MMRRAAPALRRVLLAALAVATSAATAQAPSAASAASPATPAASRPADIRALAEGVWLLPGRFERGRQPDGNSVLLLGREGLVVIDTGRHADHTQALLDWARAQKQSLRAIVNTHWHLDHLGGNALLKRELPGLRALGSAAVHDAVERRMPGFDADLAKMLADARTDETTRRMIEIDRALYSERARLVPDEVLREGAPVALELAGRRLRIGVARGVSGGDAWVLDEASGTLMVGDFVTLPAPFLDTACAEQWRAAMATLEALPFERVVPGHGPAMSREQFRRYTRALTRLLDCAAGESPAKACSDAWVEDLGPLLPEASRRSAEAMLNHYFAALLRAPERERRRFCPA